MQILKIVKTVSGKLIMVKVNNKKTPTISDRGSWWVVTQLRFELRTPSLKGMCSTS